MHNYQVASQQRICQKINFDTQQLNGLERCPNVNQPFFVKKEYINSKKILPYRANAEYYLSNEVSTVESCGQTLLSFTLDTNAIIQMTNFLIFESDAVIQVRVIDLDQSSRVVLEWDLDGTVEEWRVFNRTIDRNIERAKIVIFSSMNELSTFAIEHLHIINSAIEDDECREDEWDPKTTETTTLGTSTATVSTTISTTISTTTTSTTTFSPSSSTSTFTTTSQSTSTSTEAETTSSETTQTTDSTDTTDETSTDETSDTTETITSNPTMTTNTIPTSSESPQRRKKLFFYSTIVLAVFLAVIGVSLLICACCYTYQIYYVSPHKPSSSMQKIIPAPPLYYPPPTTYNLDRSTSDDVTQLPRLKVDNTSPIGPVITSNNHRHVQNIDLAKWTMEMDQNYGGLSDNL